MSFQYDATGIDQVYDTARGLSPEGRAFWAALLADLFGGGRVQSALDVRCGTGRFLPLLREVSGGAVVGVDPSADMLGVRYLSLPSMNLRAGVDFGFGRSTSVWTT